MRGHCELHFTIITLPFLILSCEKFNYPKKETSCDQMFILTVPYILLNHHCHALSIPNMSHQCAWQPQSVQLPNPSLASNMSPYEARVVLGPPHDGLQLPTDGVVALCWTHAVVLASHGTISGKQHESI